MSKAKFTITTNDSNWSEFQIERLEYERNLHILHQLNLIGECHSLSYDALTAHTAIVFVRYMLLALEQRSSEDQRTLGEMFFFLVDEMADITFSHSIQILMQAMIASLQQILKLSDSVRCITGRFYLSPS